MNTELSTTSILALFETDKAQRKSFVDQVVESIEEGTVNPLEIQLQIKAMEDIINSLTCTDEKKNKNTELAKKYRALLLAEAEKNGKDFEFHNSKFKVQEVGTKYNYDKCDDAELVDLLAKQEEIKAKVEQRQKMLQSLPSDGMVCPKHGNMIYPPAKSSTTAVTVSLR